jgi:spermine oxidase
VIDRYRIGSRTRWVHQRSENTNWVHQKNYHNIWVYLKIEKYQLGASEIVMSMARKPRIAIVGAGMAGLSAANRLMEACASTQLDFVVLEASDRAGGRICSAEFYGERVERGATWIHGMEGSPVYAIAKQIGAMDDREKPWEFMDGFRHNSAVLAGGLVVPPSLADPVGKLYKGLLAKVQNRMENDDIILPDDHVGEELKHGDRARGLGAYLRAGLEEYLAKNAKHSETISASPSAVLAELGQESRPNWDLRSLQEAVFHSQGHLERIMTAADDLDNVDLESYSEYWEFPGKHVPIPRGYSSVVQELVNRLPEGSIVYNAKVESIVWGCEVGISGSRAVLLKGPDVNVEADHVILTVSLGVLKSVIKNCNKNDADSVKDQPPQDPVFHGFQPPLPSRKTNAISRLGFGVVDKVLLHMGSGASEIPDVKLVFTGLKHGDGGGDLIPWWMRKAYAVVRIHKQSRVVSLWFAGKEAITMESLSDQEVIQGVLDTLSAFGMDQKKGSNNDLGGGDKGPEIDGILRSDWGKNPLFWGSYSYVPVGSTGGDIDVLAEPLPYPEDESSSRPLQILFAGEATERHYYSTTHGAYLSGLREADRLLRHYNLL